MGIDAHLPLVASTATTSEPKVDALFTLRLAPTTTVSFQNLCGG